LRKFLTRAKIHLLTLGLIIIGMITIAGNVSLVVNKSIVEKEVDEYFKHDISIGPVFYIFPNYILLNDIAIKEPKTSLKNLSFSLSRVTLRFCFVELIIKGFVKFCKINVYTYENI
jgi:hypothetical protein